MQLKDLRSRVAANIGRSSITGIDSYFNDGQRDLAKDSKKIVKASVTVADDNFTIPSNCLILKAVAYNGGELLPYPGEVLPTIYSGTPSHYMQFGSTVYVMDKATGTYTITYIPRPIDMVNDTDTPSLEDADEALIAYATWQFYQNDGNINDAAYWRSVYLEKKADWLDLDAKRNYRQIRVADRLSRWWG
jgi:hypothetical protein